MSKTAKITAICNQKGGVGKTVTTVNLGIGLAREGKKVLLVDVDPQGSLTASLGYQHPDQLEGTLADVLGYIILLYPCQIRLNILVNQCEKDIVRQYALAVRKSMGKRADAKL